MKVLLVSVNREKMPYPVFPLGLAYIARALRGAGHSVEAIDLCFSVDGQQELEIVLQRFQPQVIGLSLRNLDNLTYPNPISYLKEVEEIVQICRRLSPAKQVMGGSGFSLAPQELIAYLDIDFGIVGEGEDSFVRLLRSLGEGIPISPSSHLLVKGKNFPSSVQGARISSMTAPDRTLFDPRRYLREGGMVNLQTKRGCPFSCIYCTYPLLEGREVRLRNIEEVIEEIRQLVQEQGMDYIYFVDDIFNYPPAYAEALCRHMVRSQLKVRWSAFVNPGFLTEGLLKWMEEAGCAGVEFGTDSGSPRMLRNYGKSFTVREVRLASQLCSTLGVNHCHYLLFGGPGENEETLGETFHLMDQIDPTAVIAMLGVRIYPGTGLERLSLSQGIIQRDTPLLHPSFYISPALKGRLQEILQDNALKRNRWIVPGLEINITPNLMEGIRRFGIRGPLWELVGRMKRARVKPLGESD